MADSPPLDAFRAELREWLAAHLTDEFRAAADIRSATDDAHWETRRAWEKLLGAGGWLGVNWPTEFGGRGLDDRYHVAFVAEHFAAGAPLWATMQGRDLLAPTLLRHASQAIKERFLPPILAGDEQWGQGYSEPDAGSDLASLKTTAKLDGGRWVVNGQKIWTSFGARADWLYVLCRTDPSAPSHRGLSLLLIPAHQPGVDIRLIRHMAGGADFCEIFFSDAVTDADLVVGDVGAGWSVVMGSLDDERFLTMLPYQSRFPAQFDWLVSELARQGRLTEPLIRRGVADQYIGLRLIELTNDRLLQAVVSGGGVGAWSSLAKMRWSTWHQRFGTALVDLLGIEALVGEPTPVAQEVFLNSRAETIYGGAHEIQQTIVAERILGLPREPRVTAG
jgi:alkylation response protein AidB-like acyl-CoA dehydrogenase